MKILRTHNGGRKRQPPRASGSAHPARRDRLLGAALLCAGAALFVWLTVLLFRPIAELASNPEKFERMIRSQGAAGRVMFLGVQILQGFLPIPLELTTVAGGYVFGRVQGLLLTLCAVMLSTTAIFYFTRIFGQKLLNLFFSPAQQRWTARFRDEKLRGAMTWAVYLIPGLPKRAFTFSAGLFPQRFGKFLLISTVARIPSLLACSFGGQALQTGNYGQAVTIFLLIGVSGAVGFAFHKTTSRK